MRILFCVPAYGGSVRSETMQTVASGLLSLAKAGHEVRLFSVDMAEISRVRNLFASLALQEKWEALIMVDADMSFPDTVFNQMVDSGYDVCGLTYPKRTIDLERFHAAAQAGKTLEVSTIEGLTFIVPDGFVHDGGKLNIQKGFVEMKGLPAGCMLIRLKVLETMWKKLPEIHQTTRIDGLESSLGLKALIRCFDNIKAHDTNFSEDLSFCMRWKALGGRIHALADASVTHHGFMKFEGKYLDWLTNRFSPPVDAPPPNRAAASTAKPSKSPRGRGSR
jgi:hypothetical protein